MTPIGPEPEWIRYEFDEEWTDELEAFLDIWSANFSQAEQKVHYHSIREFLKEQRKNGLQ